MSETLRLTVTTGESESAMRYTDGNFTGTLSEWLTRMSREEFDVAFSNGYIEEIAVTESRDDPPYM